MITTLNELGLFYLVVGKPEVSRLYYGRVLKRSLAVGEKPRNIYALAGMGETYLSEGNLTKAEEYADKAIARDEEHWAYGSLLSMKGQIKLGLGNLGAAEEMLTSALEDISKSRNIADLMTVHIALARLFYKKGEEGLLIEHLKKAMELSKKYDYHYILTRLSRIDAFLLRFAIKNHVQPHYAQFLLGQVPAGYDIMASCFGGLKIKSRAGETKDIKWKRQKAKSLFCYLLANRGKRFTPDQLMEILWPEKSLSKSQTNLWNAVLCVRSVTSSLARKGTSFIEHKDGCYGIDAKCKVWCDFEEFDRLMIEARQWEARGNERMVTTAYESAIGLYEGDFLVEMYDLWMDEKRLYYKEQYLRAVEKTAGFCMKEQKFEKAIQHCNRVISVDEFRESSYLMAMQAHVALGNRKSAIDLYERLKRVLKDELGFEPSSEAENLLNQLTKGV
jgi:two-component SAPR family response regulator